MPTIHLETFIQAPLEVCFDLVRDVDLHTKSAAKTKERAVAGVTSGLMKLGDEVTWEAVHFGVRQRLTAKISRFERPNLLVTEQVKGAFAWFHHTHSYIQKDGGTVMVDDFAYASPLGLLGRLADVLFVERHMRQFLAERAQGIKEAGERESKASGRRLKAAV